VAEQQLASVVKKNSMGKPVNSGQKIMIHNIYAKFREQNEALSKTEMVKRVSEAAGIGLTCSELATKEKESHEFLSKIGRDGKKNIRQIVHSFFLRRELPTLNKCCSCS
jgi:hypothetical protein